MHRVSPPNPLSEPVTSPVVAVSSDRPGMESFFASLGVRYIQADIYEDDRARADARRAAHQFDVFKNTLLDSPELRREEWVEELIESCLSVQPAIAERGVIDDLAICFINDLIGYGCFVQRDLSEGEHVGVYTGVISEATCIDKNSAYIMASNPWYSTFKVNAYFGILDIPEPWPRMTVNSEKAGNEIRFVNHIEEGARLMGTSASAANLDVHPYFHHWKGPDGIRGLFHSLIVAARDIGAGEELRFDYGAEYWKEQGVVPANSSVYKLSNDRLVEVMLTS